jgi:hypothetical protein
MKGLASTIAAGRAEVNKLIERAKTGKRDSAVVKLTPGMAAILFVEYNRNNREWSPRPPNRALRRVAGEMRLWAPRCAYEMAMGKSGLGH